MHESGSAQTVHRYSRPAAAMHWMSAGLLLGAVWLGLSMVDLPMSIQRLKYFNWHKWIGIAILLLVVLRIIWRGFKRPPPAVAAAGSMQRRLAAAVHALLYTLMLAVPLIGWAYSSAAGFPVTWLGLIPLPDWVPKDRELSEVLKSVHQFTAYVLIALITLHITAALKHHFIDRDGLLARMRPW